MTIEQRKKKHKKKSQKTKRTKNPDLTQSFKRDLKVVLDEALTRKSA